jgi:uncharacterized protein (DUF1330 family)
MPRAYLVVEYIVTDAAMFRDYLSKGRITEFPNIKSLNDRYHSPEYQPLIILLKTVHP